MSNIDQTLPKPRDILPLNSFGEIRPGVKEVESQPWYQSYAATIVELDPKKLVQLMSFTEAAIQARLQDLRHDSDHHHERQMMADAQRSLSLLREVS